jgi:hypothetical protein
MKSEEIVAKSKGTDVAKATIEIPETLAEASEMFGDEKVLSYFVQQYKIKELNRIRNEATQGYRIPKAIKDKLLEMDDDKRRMTAELLEIPMEALEQLLAD